jgi:transposase-like protein
MRRIDVGSRPTSRGELARWYSEALEAQATSGLSVAEFAHRMGVSVPTLYMWRRRLGSSHGTEALPAKFVEVTVRPSSASTHTEPGAMVVRLCSGRRSVDVPIGFDDDELRRLITTLESC